MENDKGLIIVLSGFSGAGKGTIMKHLLKSHPSEYHLSISATTRKKRPGEQEGREYFFKSKEEFQSMIDNDELLKAIEEAIEKTVYSYDASNRIYYKKTGFDVLNTNVYCVFLYYLSNMLFILFISFLSF